MEYITELLQQNPALTAAAAGLVVVVAAWKLVSRPSTPKPKITRQLVIPDADVWTEKFHKLKEKFHP